MVLSQSEFRKMEAKLESLEETMDVLADKTLLLSIKRSLDDIKQGRYKDYPNVKQFRQAFESRS
jgi:hypothetical protein